MMRIKVTILQSFNSRSPGGVRPGVVPSELYGTEFQFTHPGRGATSPGCAVQRPCIRFNSRTPGGVRLTELKPVEVVTMFQFTHPGRGATV